MRTRRAEPKPSRARPPSSPKCRTRSGRPTEPRMTTRTPDPRPSTRPTLSWRSSRSALGSGTPSERTAFLARLSPDLQQLIREGWLGRGGEHQLVPDDDWAVWLILGGRGAGKTRAGAEWVNGMAGGLLGIARTRAMRIALVGETFADVRDVMIGGPSGIVAVAPPGERPQWKPSLRRLEWRNGAVAHAFSAEDPDSLRGPQFEAAWSDEIGKWRHADATWDMLQFALRLGERPRQVVTTTPRAIPLVRKLLADPGVRVTHARTADNAQNLAPGFLERVTGGLR